MVVICSKVTLIRILFGMIETIHRHKDELTELDTKIGDADHGISLCRGFEAVRHKLPEIEDQCIGTILKTTGMTLVSTVGGASGPLYGSAFMFAGNQATGKETLTSDDITVMFQAALEGIVKRGHAQIGDKTMVDTLAPVVEFLNSPERQPMEWPTIMEKALSIAKTGMESTREMMALKGRASFLKERSIGHLDPGAVSCYLILKTILAQPKVGCE